MGRARIILTDNADGGLDCLVEYEGGFDPQSPAHAHIELLHEALGAVAMPNGDAVHFNVEEMREFKAAAEKRLADELAAEPPTLQGLLARHRADEAEGEAQPAAVTEHEGAEPD